ncbi:hypothetical protein EAY71_22150 [Vibrio anguillarum]|nr:hypothetical protein [Vibrio anguillarum]MBF4269571.1 hypothetical protein [Vibrio anguillarum]MBF4425584.1 hypothetical protein [Vibrio anguillarum]
MYIYANPQKFEKQDIKIYSRVSFGLGFNSICHTASESKSIGGKYINESAKPLTLQQYDLLIAVTSLGLNL